MQSYSGSLLAGAATRDITPSYPVFLYGYPFVSRYSTGVHDPLLSSALYLSDGKTEAMFVANDIISIGKASVRRIRERIASFSSVPARNILISGTHTHSGPMTLDYISNADDPVVPKTDLQYVRDLEEAVVAAAREAISNAGPAEVGLAVADGLGIGTNRHDPQGPADREVPVLMVRSALHREVIACMLVCSMHPTVLHEDSTLISGDFPAMARQYLQQEVLRRRCPVLHHTGPSGNLSPRHVTTSNTFAEVQRLGQVLGRSIAAAIDPIAYSRSLSVQCAQTWVDLPRRSFPTVADAEANRKRAMKFLKDLRLNNASRQQIRTAEVDWFGAEESVTLARAAAEGRLEAVLESCLPVEIQIIRIGPWSFVGWQGEIFVEYALAVKARARNTFLISLANGDLQGYICTSEAFQQGFYEAGNCLFDWMSGELLVHRSLELLCGLVQ